VGLATGDTERQQAAEVALLGCLTDPPQLALVGYAWLFNVIRADEGVARAAMFGAMGGMFIAAITIPEAFDDLPSGLHGPAVFAACYFVVRVMHILMFWLASRDDPTLRGQVMRFLAQPRRCSGSPRWPGTTSAPRGRHELAAQLGGALRRAARADHHRGARRVDRLHRHRGGPTCRSPGRSSWRPGSGSR
jgi:Bacterial low temperature requirement A protein (LtrA)